MYFTPEIPYMADLYGKNKSIGNYYKMMSTLKTHKLQLLPFIK